MSIAIAHEHYPARGGGEAVADELATIFDAPIVTGWIKDSSYSNHEPIELLENTPANVLRRFFGEPLVRDLFYMFAFESCPSLRDYDVVIQSGNAPSWYVPEEDQTIVKYNHSPPRNPFDLFWRDKSHTAGPLDIVHPGYIIDRLYKKSTRHLWKNRTDSVDVWVCNSEIIAHRTKKYLGVPEEKITVVYPPVDVESYTPTSEKGDYYVALSRLEPAKRFDVVIEAFHELNKNGDYKLKIAGDGNSREELEDLAGDADYIEFEGYVSEERKRELLTNAKASIFAAENEDFGIVPIESMAAGTPVIGVEDGFTQFQIKDTKNGILFERSVDDLVGTVQEFEFGGVEWDAETMHRFTEQFSRERFAAEMRQVVDRAVRDNEIESQVTEPELITND